MTRRSSLSGTLCSHVSPCPVQIGRASLSSVRPPPLSAGDAPRRVRRLESRPPLQRRAARARVPPAGRGAARVRNSLPPLGVLNARTGGGQGGFVDYFGKALSPQDITEKISKYISGCSLPETTDFLNPPPPARAHAPGRLQLAAARARAAADGAARAGAQARRTRPRTRPTRWGSCPCRNSSTRRASSRASRRSSAGAVGGRARPAARVAGGAGAELPIRVPR